jgi:hypothetical protein
VIAATDKLVPIYALALVICNQRAAIPISSVGTEEFQMKIVMGSARHNANDLKWFRKRARGLPLDELKRRLENGEPVLEWDPAGDILEFDDEAPFRRIEEILSDAKQNGVALSFYEIDDANTVDDLPDDLEELSPEVAHNLIERYRQTRYWRR